MSADGQSEPDIDSSGHTYIGLVQYEYFRNILERSREQLCKKAGWELEKLTLIRKIDFKLEEIKRQEFGYCGICGVEIGLTRLEARPLIDVCVECSALTDLLSYHLQPV